jgi:hypothetical protein
MRVAWNVAVARLYVIRGLWNGIYPGLDLAYVTSMARKGWR